MSTIAPKMGTSQKSGLSSALFGKTRDTLLALFLTHPEESYYLRQLTRETGLGLGNLRRELGNLTEAGILTRFARGNQAHYQANRSCPIFNDLRGLMTKTAGLADVVREALEPFSDRIEVAFVYGSQASGTADSSSDIDLLVVGDPDELELHRAISQAEERLSSPVNYTAMSREEYRKKTEEKGGVLQRILRGEKIWILGHDGTD